jgi:hypothetical protein
MIGLIKYSRVVILQPLKRLGATLPPSSFNLKTLITCLFSLLTFACLACRCAGLCSCTIAFTPYPTWCVGLSTHVDLSPVFRLSSDLVNCLVRLRILLQQLRISLRLSVFSPERHRQHCPPTSRPPIGCPAIPACPTISSPPSSLSTISTTSSLPTFSLSSTLNKTYYNTTPLLLTSPTSSNDTSPSSWPPSKLTQPCNRPFCTSFEKSSPQQLLPPFTLHFRCPGFLLTPYPVSLPAQHIPLPLDILPSTPSVTVAPLAFLPLGPSA